jgi:hypothetical protein
MPAEYPTRPFVDYLNYALLVKEMHEKGIHVFRVVSPLGFSTHRYAFRTGSRATDSVVCTIERQDLIEMLSEGGYDSLATYVEMGACFGS